MAFENVRNTVPGLAAGADLSTHQFKAVKVDTTTNERVVLASVAGERVVGILQNKPTSGVAATIACPGSTTKMVASAAIATGAFITTTNVGTAVTAASTNNVLGVALHAVTAANQLVTVQLADLGNAP
jgi:hypothetical protein